MENPLRDEPNRRTDNVTATRRSVLEKGGAAGVGALTLGVLGSGMATAQTATRRVDITSHFAPSRATYLFAVDGNINELGDNPEDHIEPGGTVAHGVVAGGTDSYEVNGDITALDAGSAIDIAIDGSPIDPSEFLDDTITIEGPDEGRAEYDLVVDGALVQSQAYNATIDPNDTISEHTGAHGQVGYNGRDSYAISGSVVEVPTASGMVVDFDISNADGAVSVYLNGDEIAPNTLPAATGAGKRHTFEISGDGGRVDYQLTVSGYLEGSRLTGEDSIEPVGSADEEVSGGSVSGSVATGAVSGGTDTYRFRGSVTSLSLSNDTTLTFDGEDVDPSRYHDHTLTIAGTGSHADYTFIVDGAVASRRGLTGEDSIDVKNSRVEGAVARGSDEYLYDGTIENFEMNGTADVYIDGKQVDGLH
jgi:hypothetical protein